MERNSESSGPCDAQTQCDLPSCKPGRSRHVLRCADQVLWTQKTVFHRGCFIDVRELGCQTDPLTSQDTRHEHDTSLTVNSACAGAPRSAPISSSVDTSIATSFSGDRDLVSRESVGSKRTPRSSRPATSNRPTTSDLTDEEVQEHVYGLTRNARNRACELLDHVEELNRVASAALIASRQFQSDFNPCRAFECGGSRRSQRSAMDRSCDQWSSRASNMRQSSRGSSRGKSSGKNKALPGLGASSRPGSKHSKFKHSSKMPWHELQGILSGCPDAALGSKVLAIGVEPWRPAILSELPTFGSSLHERLASSAAVYLPGERSTKERKHKASLLPPKTWVS